MGIIEGAWTYPVPLSPGVNHGGELYPVLRLFGLDDVREMH